MKIQDKTKPQTTAEKLRIARGEAGGMPPYEARVVRELANLVEGYREENGLLWNEVNRLEADVARLIDELRRAAA